MSSDGRTVGRTDRPTDGRTHYYSPLRLTSGDNKALNKFWKNEIYWVENIKEMNNSLFHFRQYSCKKGCYKDVIP